MRKLYKREDLGKGVRGKYYAAYSKGHRHAAMTAVGSSPDRRNFREQTVSEQSYSAVKHRKPARCPHSDRDFAHYH